MKVQVDESASWWKCKLMKVQVDVNASWWMQVDVNASWSNESSWVKKLMKQVDKTAVDVTIS